MNNLLKSFLILTSIIIGQSMEDLTDGQKKEYNRKKLTVEPVTTITSWYSFMVSSTNLWSVHQGLSKVITPEEFFRITGYIKEANETKKRKEEASTLTVLGGIGVIAGSVMSVIPKTETVDLDYGITYEEVSYPYLWPGLIISSLGVLAFYSGISQSFAPIAPYETVKNISDDYNAKLLINVKTGESTKSKYYDEADEDDW